MSSSNCYFLTCIQISQEAGQVVWYSHLFQNFPQFLVIHTVKWFSVVHEAEVDVFLELSCFVSDSTDVGSLISGASAFSKPSLNIWKFTVQVLLKPGMDNFEHSLLAYEISAVVQSFEHSLALEWKLTFSSLMATAEFSKCAGILSAALSQHHLSGFEIAQLEFHHLH